MLEDKSELRKIISTVKELLKAEKDFDLVELLSSSEINAEQTYYDNWNGGTTYYSIYINVSVEMFVKHQALKQEKESKIKEKLDLVLGPNVRTQIGQVIFIPISNATIEWDLISDLFGKDQLISEIESLKNTLISVSTGEKIIQDVNSEYQKKYIQVALALKKIYVENPNSFSDLWQWYSRWKSGDFPKYIDRRIFISEMYDSLLNTLKESDNTEHLNILLSLSGWERIERTVKEIKIRLKKSKNEEQFKLKQLPHRKII